MSKQQQVATFAGGCFWCTEAIFQRIKGVISVTSGYTGGTVAHPSYEEVCTGETGHAEAIQITFDSAEISFSKLLEIFFLTHDPTTLNRQGDDVGTQYRSAIFYHDETQKELAQAFIQHLTENQVYEQPIVTELTKFTKFYPAEDYHQNYYNQNRSATYCRLIIEPKLQKLIDKQK